MRGGSASRQQLGGRLESVHHRHPDVHEHDVGSGVARRQRAPRARRRPPPRPRDRAASRSACGCRRGTAPDHRRAPRGSGRAGRVTRATGPAPIGQRRRHHELAVLAGARSRPPARAARSRMPMSPWPESAGRSPVFAPVAHLEVRPGRDARPARTRTGRPSPWRRALVSASWRMRYTASCTAGGRFARRGRVDVDAQLDAGGAHLGVELLEVGESSAAGPSGWLWRSWVSSSRTSASAARAVVEIVPSASIAALLAGCGGVGCGGVPRPVGLRDHDGERVRHDVVHVPRDPHPLLLGGGLGLGALLRLAVLAARAPRCAPAHRPSTTAAARSAAATSTATASGSVCRREPAAGERRAEEQIRRDDQRAGERRGETRPVHPRGPVGGSDVEHAEDREVRHRRRAAESHLQ